MVKGGKIIKKRVKPGKDIAGSVVEEFRIKLLKLINQEIDELAIDMKGISMIDSAGLGLLIAARNSLGQTGGKLSLTNVPENIINLLKMTGVDRYLDANAAQIR
ncbi:MAG: STAS domain-containing protein [Deltaproteobacteria bacterium]|jgi:anti-anti-sigma factor|nr:STAS domain-containing protein [Deltaproteobacteria bacterium]